MQIPVSKDTACRSCAHGDGARPPGGCSGGTNGNLWRVASGVLQGTYLSVHLEHPYHGNSCKTVVGQVAPANQIPLVVHPTRTSKESNPEPQKDGSGRPWTCKVSKNGQNQSRNRPESYCSNGNTCLHAVTWTWAKLF